MTERNAYFRERASPLPVASFPELASSSRSTNTLHTSSLAMTPLRTPLPKTPPALSHYVDLTPARVRHNRPSSTLPAPSGEDIERFRLEAEERQKREAEFWGYGRKVRPGSRMGLDNRKMPQNPPWAQSR